MRRFLFLGRGARIFLPQSISEQDDAVPILADVDAPDDVEVQLRVVDVDRSMGAEAGDEVRELAIILVRRDSLSSAHSVVHEAAFAQFAVGELEMIGIFAGEGVSPDQCAVARFPDDDPLLDANSVHRLLAHVAGDHVSQTDVDCVQSLVAREARQFDVV